MKTIAIAGIFAILLVLAYVSASMEMEYIESGSCDYVRNYETGQKNCKESAPASKWSLISENSPNCVKTQEGCELKVK